MPLIRAGAGGCLSPRGMQSVPERSSSPRGALERLSVRWGDAPSASPPPAASRGIAAVRYVPPSPNRPSRMEGESSSAMLEAVAAAVAGLVAQAMPSGHISMRSTLPVQRSMCWTAAPLALPSPRSGDHGPNPCASAAAPSELRDAREDKTGQDSEQANKGNQSPHKSPHGVAADLLRLEQLLANSNLNAYIQSIFEQADSGGVGSLDAIAVDRLVQTMSQDLRIPPPSTKDLRHQFKKFDTNCNGKIELGELQLLYVDLLRAARDKHTGLQRREFFLQKIHGNPWDRYQQEEIIGQGTFGIVTRCLDSKSGNQVVVKTVSKMHANMPAEQLEREILTLRDLDHPHILRLFGWLEDYNNVYIVTDLAEGGDLFRVMEKIFLREQQPLKESWMARVTQHCLKAISYCHARKVIHKDLKVENIMLLHSDDNHINPHAVVIDFGLAEMFYSTDRARTVAGSPQTMAPEVWRGDFGFKCDVWSMGCVLFALLSGANPFDCDSANPVDWLRLIGHGADWRLCRQRSKRSQDLCSRMLQADESLRPTAADCINHEWLTTGEVRSSATLPKGLLKKLGQTSHSSHLQQALCLRVATMLPSKLPIVAAAGEIFSKLDSDHDGMLSRKELIQAFTGLGLRRDDAAEILDGLDLDRDGCVSYTELLSGLVSVQEGLLEEHLWSAFGTIDSDGSGTLSRAELSALVSQGQLHQLGLVPSDKAVDAIMDDFQLSPEGEITFDAFRAHFAGQRQMRGVDVVASTPSPKATMAHDRTRVNVSRDASMRTRIEPPTADGSSTALRRPSPRARGTSPRVRGERATARGELKTVLGQPAAACGQSPAAWNSSPPARSASPRSPAKPALTRGTSPTARGTAVRVLGRMAATR